MKWFFDTSVLVPAFLDEHIHHRASLAAYLKADRTQACCAAHSLAEVYAMLTRIPGKHRASTDQAMLFLENMAERLSFISLGREEYWAAIARAAEVGIAGGTIYDALLARCALKAKAEIIYTWNVGHFRQFGGEVAKRVRTP
jgi:predicted nucleic acid-binding protein